MRRPTSADEAYSWYNLVMAGASPAINQEAQCGFFKRRLVKGGPWVPARIWLDSDICQETGELMSDETLQCDVNGAWADADEQWPWLCANPISCAEFNYMTALAEHCARHEPDHPAANPRRAINDLETPLHF